VVYVGGLGYRNRFGNHQPSRLLTTSCDRRRKADDKSPSVDHYAVLGIQKVTSTFFSCVFVCCFCCLVNLPVFLPTDKQQNRKQDGMYVKTPPAASN